MTKIILAALLVGGCATSSQIYLPDGRQGFNINCPGAANNWGNCFAKAGEICGARGYDIINRDGSVVPMASGYANPYGGGFVAGGMVSRTLMVACKRRSRNEVSKGETSQ